MFRISIIASLLLVSTLVSAQVLSGQFSGLKNQELVLEGFRGAKPHRIAKFNVDQQGKFTFSYAEKDYGMAVLKTSSGHSLLVLLNGEDIYIQANNLENTSEVSVTQGPQNVLLAQYNKEQVLRDKAVEAWAFLDDLYYNEAFLSNSPQSISTVQQLMIDELERLRLQEQQFIQTLPRESYLSWFLNTKKLISGVGNVIKYRPEYAENYVQVFRQLNYGDVRLYKSGLLSSAVGNHFWLIEKTYTTEEQILSAAKESIDIIYAQLAGKDDLIAEMTDFMITLFTQQSLDDLSEYLATKVLNEEACTLDAKLEYKLESYRKMKAGNTAADITFGANTNFPEGMAKANKLSEIDADYKLVVFAADWCGHCQKELPELVELYPKMRDNSIEVVLVSLDETPDSFTNFAGSFPFISTCDFKKWESVIVRDYHVFATPTYYLLDRELTIIMKLKSPEDLAAWVKQH